MREVAYPTRGKILLEEFLKPMGITQYRLAKEIFVPQRRIGEIVAGKRAITVDTGLRLSRFFGMSDGFWIGLQTDYDTAQARDALADVLSRIHRFEPAHQVDFQARNLTIPVTTGPAVQSTRFVRRQPR